MNNSEVTDQQMTISLRMDALLHLLPRDDRVSFHDSLERIKSAIMDYLKSANLDHDKLDELLRSVYENVRVPKEEYNSFYSSVGDENVELYYRIKAMLITITFVDDSAPTTKDLTKIYNAFVPHLQKTNDYDIIRTIKNQWKSQIKSTSNDFMRQQHRNAFRRATSEDIFAHLEWDCDSRALKKQVQTILYGNVSPHFNLHNDRNLSITTLRTLRPTSLISDFIVCYFSKLVKTEDEHAYYKVYHVSDNELKERNRNISYWEKKYQSTSKIDLGTRKLILLFPRCNNTHFTIYKVFRDQPTDKTKICVEEYNSLRMPSSTNTLEVEGSYEHDLSEFYMKFLQSHCHGEHFDISVEVEIETDIRHIVSPQQKNGYDCGVFCILYLCALTQSIQLDLNQINQEYIDHNHLRNWILASIINKRILFPSYRISEIE